MVTHPPRKILGESLYDIRGGSLFTWGLEL